MEILRRDRVGFYIMTLIVVAVGWIGGANGFLFTLPVFLLYGLLLWRRQLYDDLLIGFLLTLILSDALPDQLPGLEYAKQLKNVYILFLTFVLIVDRKNFQPFNRFFIKFVPFFLIAAIALYASETIEVSIQKTLSYILIFIIVPNYVSICYRRNGLEFFGRIFRFIVFIIVFCIALKYVMPMAATSHGSRLRGFFGNPNGFGVFLTLSVILVSVIRNYFPQIVTRYAFTFAYAVILIAAFMTGSRAALLAIILFLLFIQIFKFSPVIGFIGFLSVLLYINTITGLFVDLIVSFGLGETFRLETLQEGSGRFIAWNFAWSRIQDYFFIGRGIGYDEHLMRSNFDFLSRQGHEGGVHNTYLIIWLNTGLIGLVLFFRAFFLYFIRASSNTRIALPAMFTIMFSIMFEPWLASSLNPYTSLFLISMTVIASTQFTALGTEELNQETANEEEKTLVTG